MACAMPRNARPCEQSHRVRGHPHFQAELTSVKTGELPCWLRWWPPLPARTEMSVSAASRQANAATSGGLAPRRRRRHPAARICSRVVGQGQIAALSHYLPRRRRCRRWVLRHFPSMTGREARRRWRSSGKPHSRCRLQRSAPRRDAHVVHDSHIHARQAGTVPRIRSRAAAASPSLTERLPPLPAVARAPLRPPAAARSQLGVTDSLVLPETALSQAELTGTLIPNAKPSRTLTTVSLPARRTRTEAAAGVPRTPRRRRHTRCGTFTLRLLPAGPPASQTPTAAAPPGAADITEALARSVVSGMSASPTSDLCRGGRARTTAAPAMVRSGAPLTARPPTSHHTRSAGA